MHRLDDGQLVHDRRQVGKHFRKLCAALAVSLKGESRRHQAGVGTDEGIALVFHYLGRNRLAVEPPQRRLEVEEVKLAGRTGHEQEDDPPGLARKVRRPGRHR